MNDLGDFMVGPKQPQVLSVAELGGLGLGLDARGVVAVFNKVDRERGFGVVAAVCIERRWRNQQKKTHPPILASPVPPGNART